MYSVLRASLFTGMAVFWMMFGGILFVGGLSAWPAVIIPGLAWWLLGAFGGLFVGSLVGGGIFFMEYMDARGKGLHVVWGDGSMIDIYEEIDVAEVGHHFNKMEMAK